MTVCLAVRGGAAERSLADQRKKPKLCNTMQPDRSKKLSVPSATARFDQRSRRSPTSQLHATDYDESACCRESVPNDLGSDPIWTNPSRDSKNRSSSHVLPVHLWQVDRPDEDPQGPNMQPLSPPACSRDVPDRCQRLFLLEFAAVLHGNPRLIEPHPGS